MAKAIRVQLLYNEWKNVENEAIDLAHIFNVDKFLTALRQQAARFILFAVLFIYLFFFLFIYCQVILIN